MEAQQLLNLDIAIRRPETITESEAEILAREQARQLYKQSHPGYHQRIDPYEAGWKAAKAYYESK